MNRSDAAEPLTGSVLLGVMTITAATLFLQIALTKFFLSGCWRPRRSLLYSR